MKTEWPSCLKHTKQREEIMMLLQDSAEPLSASDLFGRVSDINLSTIYRILAAFEANHLVETIVLPDEDTTLYKWSAGEHKHYATCLGCHKQIALTGCPVAELKLLESTPEFTITAHRLELFGYCKDCLQKNGKT